MRQVKLSNNTIIEVRGLTRREVRRCKDVQIDFGRLTPERAEEAMDAVLAMVLAPDVKTGLEDLCYQDSLRVWRAVLSETFGAPDEEKNSSSAGGGPPTASA
jgi:hypothetical protein